MDFQPLYFATIMQKNQTYIHCLSSNHGTKANANKTRPLNFKFRDCLFIVVLHLAAYLHISKVNYNQFKNITEPLITTRYSR